MPVPMPPIPGQAGGSPQGLNLPKSPVGGSPGPGASPMVSPGGGDGMRAVADDGFRNVIKQIMTLLKHYEGQPQSQQFKAGARALTTLTAAFGKAQPEEGGPTGMPKPPAPIGNAAPVGPGGPPPGLPMRGAGAGMGPGPGMGM
jgi:hypothetical protein